jgi:hypothetical protein
MPTANRDAMPLPTNSPSTNAMTKHGIAHRKGAGDADFPADDRTKITSTQVRLR